MDIFKGLNLLVRFLLELCMLAATGCYVKPRGKFITAVFAGLTHCISLGSDLSAGWAMSFMK